MPQVSLHLCQQIYVEFFLEIFREDCAAGDDAGSTRKLVHEICKQRSLIKMTNADTPDEMCARYTSMVTGKPADASLWSVTLFSSYCSALITNL